MEINRVLHTKAGKLYVPKTEIMRVKWSKGVYKCEWNASCRLLEDIQRK